MFRRLIQRNTTDLVALMQGHFLEARALYALLFDALPCVSFVGELEINAVFTHIDAHYKLEIKNSYQHAYFDHGAQQMLFNNTIFVLSHKRIIELGPSYVQVLHSPLQYGWAHALVKELAAFRQVQPEPVIGFARGATSN